MNNSNQTNKISQIIQKANSYIVFIKNQDLITKQEREQSINLKNHTMGSGRIQIKLNTEPPPVGFMRQKTELNNSNNLKVKQLPKQTSINQIKLTSYPWTLTLRSYLNKLRDMIKEFLDQMVIFQDIYKSQIAQMKSECDEAIQKFIIENRSFNQNRVVIESQKRILQKIRPINSIQRKS